MARRTATINKNQERAVIIGAGITESAIFGTSKARRLRHFSYKPLSFQLEAFVISARRLRHFN